MLKKMHESTEVRKNITNNVGQIFIKKFTNYKFLMINQNDEKLKFHFA